jgi:very-short-patch-repair endonuclease
MGDGAIRHRVRSGRLYPEHRAVYGVGVPVTTPRARDIAAVLAVGPSAALSWASAVALLELIPGSGPAVRHVSVAGRDCRLSTVRVHRVGELPAHERTVVHGIPTTTALRTLLDLAATDTPDHLLQRALNEAQVRRLLKASDISTLRNRPGARRLRALVEQPTLTRSEAERRALALIRQAQLPTPETNVKIHGHEVDLLWRDQGLVVEIDGYAFHGTRQAFERDRRRDADLERAGLHVIRLSWRMLADEPLAAVALIATALTSRR